MIKMIAAVSSNGVIGLKNKLPFDYPEDLKHFKRMTLNKTIIMGRKTFEGIGKPLPKRRNVVITMNTAFINDAISYSSLKDAIEKELKINPEQDIWLCGGASIYEEGMNYADEIHLTVTPDVYEGDIVRFPWINPRMFKIKQWEQLVPGDDTLMYYIYESVKSL